MLQNNMFYSIPCTCQS